jgi:hypothetical protein
MALEALPEIVSKYRCAGRVEGADFLLPPEIAVSWVTDLAALKVLIVGCDLRKYVDNGAATMELIGGGSRVNHRLRRDDVQYNAQMIKDFLTNQWPAEADLVSFVYADAETWDLILRHAKCQ